MCKPTRMLSSLLCILFPLASLTVAYPSTLNITSFNSQDNACKCNTKGRFCVGIDDNLSGICPGNAIITCKKKNLGKAPNQIQYCYHGSIWARENSQCYRKESGRQTGKLYCS
ncbi:uncharacterized protein RAG0_08868 [Rhynchosporium agropyri]|uniref:Secreted protein n=1 Tax=Rhynchosporium agropyri TaxID=914238 RepID=A0A1E1KSS8_9HELO|nr:uncharacterized protein RAG0_08868 [Rhynchosporium agropyri]